MALLRGSRTGPAHLANRCRRPHIGDVRPPRGVARSPVPSRHHGRRAGSRCESGAVPPLSAPARGEPDPPAAVPDDPGRGPRGGPVSHPLPAAPAFALLSTSDTDLLSARASGAGWRLGNPARLGAEGIAGPGGRRRRSSSSGSSAVRRQYEEMLAPLLAGPRAGRRARRRAGARRRADGAVDGADGRGHRGARLPRAGRPGEPGPAAPLPVRHRAAHRRGLRAARGRPEWGVLDAPRRAATRGRGRRPLLPGAPPGREHRLRRGALPTRSRTPAGSALPVFCASLRRPRPELLDDAAHRATPWWSPCSPPAAPAGDRAGRRRRRGVGRRRSSRRWTCRSCRACA